MDKMRIYFEQPYREKGIVKASLDFALRALTLIVWGYLVIILGGLLVDAFVRGYNPMLKLWWFSYCFTLFFASSWLAYIILFVRDYYEGAD